MQGHVNESFRPSAVFHLLFAVFPENYLHTFICRANACSNKLNPEETAIALSKGQIWLFQQLQSCPIFASYFVYLTFRNGKPDIVVSGAVCLRSGHIYWPKAAGPTDCTKPLRCPVCTSRSFTNIECFVDRGTRHNMSLGVTMRCIC